MWVMGGRGSINPVLAQGRGGASNGLLTNLIAYWKLDEASGNAIDAHTNGLTLTAANAPGADTGKVYPTARTFNGSSQSFSRNSETALRTGDIDFALAAWVYLSNLSITSGDIISKGAEYFLYYRGSGSGGPSKYRLLLSTGAFVTGDITPTINTWQLVMAWHDATANKIYISLNNSTPVEAAAATGPTADTGVLYVGREAAVATFWPGRLGPIAFWKNRILSAADRTALWNGGNGLAYSGFTA